MIGFPRELGICDAIMCDTETLKLDCNIYHPVSSRDLRESDANGFVQRAISAANVYNNIVKYIDDANITSLTTFNLSQRAEDVCYITETHSIHPLSFLSTFCSFIMCSVFQAITGIGAQLGYLVTQSDNVFKESVSLHSEQIGMGPSQSEIPVKCFHCSCVHHLMSLWHSLYLSVTEVEAEVADKLKYIEETKETMDKNTNKLTQLVEEISGIHTGKTILSLFCFVCPGFRIC